MAAFLKTITIGTLIFLTCCSSESGQRSHSTAFRIANSPISAKDQASHSNTDPAANFEVGEGDQNDDYYWEGPETYPEKPTGDEPSEEPTYEPEEETGEWAQDDEDRDGLNAYNEAQWGTDPLNGDTDGDGWLDGTEVELSTNPTDPDDNPDTAYGDQLYQCDDPDDCDADGLSDEQEAVYGTDPQWYDTDNDGLKDGIEISLGSDPLNHDTDGDTISDGDEVNLYGTNPLDPSSYPGAPTPTPTPTPGPVVKHSKVPAKYNFDAYTSEPAVSADGRYVAFVSSATNVMPPLVGNGFKQVYLYDRQEDTLRLISASNKQSAFGNGGPTRVQGDNDSYQPTISGNGQFIAFTSKADNFAIGASNSHADVYLYSMENDRIAFVSFGYTGIVQYGDSQKPSISYSGKTVFFQSTNRLATEDPSGHSDIYAYSWDSNFDNDSKGGGTVNRKTSGNEPSYNAVVSGDGLSYAFSTLSTNITSEPTNGQYQVYVKYSQNTGFIMASKNSLDQAGDRVSTGPKLSYNGRYLLFTSYASNLISGETHLNSSYDVFLRDVRLGTIEKISRSFDGSETNAASTAKDISGDGRFLVYSSKATNLFPHDTNGVTNEVVVYDRWLDKSERLFGEGSNDLLINPSTNTSTLGGAKISRDGKFVAFYSEIPNLDPSDQNEFNDTYIYEAGEGLAEVESKELSCEFVDDYGNLMDIRIQSSVKKSDGRAVELRVKNANASLDSIVTSFEKDPSGIHAYLNITATKTQYGYTTNTTIKIVKESGNYVLKHYTRNDLVHDDDVICNMLDTSWTF